MNIILKMTAVTSIIFFSVISLTVPTKSIANQHKAVVFMHGIFGKSTESRMIEAFLKQVRNATFYFYCVVEICCLLF